MRVLLMMTMATLLVAGCGGLTGNDQCSPYSGSYLGSLVSQWTNDNGSPGIAKVSMNFNASCIGKVGEQVTLSLDDVNSNDPYFGTGTGTETPASAGMQMPVSPPASGDNTFGITISFQNGAELEVDGPLTVNTRGDIANDLQNTGGWSVGTNDSGVGYVPPGQPASVSAQTWTYNFDKSAR